MPNEAVESMTKPISGGPNLAEQTRSGVFYRPNVDIIELPEELLVVVDVPGAAGDCVDVHFEDGMLTIHAKVPVRHEDIDFLLQEYGVGDYYRTFRVAETVDASKITAEFTDGVLTLHLPKAESIKPRKIAVRTQQ